MLICSVNQVFHLSKKMQTLKTCLSNVMSIPMQFNFKCEFGTYTYLFLLLVVSPSLV